MFFEKLRVLLGRQNVQIAQVAEIQSFTTMEGYTILVCKPVDVKMVQMKRSYRDVVANKK